MGYYRDMIQREMTYQRRPTRAVHVGNIIVGGGHPVVVQSMITEETRNVDACVARSFDAQSGLARSFA